MEGSATAQFDRLTARELDVDIAGSGELALAGKVQRQALDLAGSGEYNAAKLESDDSDIRINGSGSAEVHAKDSLAVVIRGNGEVKYAGKPLDPHRGRRLRMNGAFGGALIEQSRRVNRIGDKSPDADGDRRG